MKSTNPILVIVGVVLLLAGIIYGIFVDWSHPDFTDKRMLIECWPQMLLSLVLMLVGLACIGAGGGRN